MSVFGRKGCVANRRLGSNSWRYDFVPPSCDSLALLSKKIQKVLIDQAAGILRGRSASISRKKRPTNGEDPLF